MTITTKKFSLIVEIDLQTLSEKYMEGSETEPESFLSMIEYECQWIQDSGIHLKDIQEIKEIEGIDFQAAEHAINQDGSFLHQINSRWGIFDAGESPAHPVVNYTYPTKEELIICYFDDMGWDLNLYALSSTNSDRPSPSPSTINHHHQPSPSPSPSTITINHHHQPSPSPSTSTITITININHHHQPSTINHQLNLKSLLQAIHRLGGAYGSPGSSRKIQQHHAVHQIGPRHNSKGKDYPSIHEIIAL